MIALNMPLEANMKSYLRKLFDCTQTKEAKVFGAWVLIPWMLGMASKGMWDLAWATNALVQGMSFWQSFPYVAACAVVFALTGCGKMVSIQLRREHKLFYRTDLVAQGTR
ncbi:hypothetical protein ABMQ39_09565 [Pseudomonas alloputida]|uniref:hypothetical protein n=1 Tax=Pseudomonas alloputida TaxID=1940621 RepID=UPI0032ED2809